MADLTKDLHRILKDSEQELAQLMFNYLSFQFGEQVSVSDDYRSGKTDNSVAKLTKNNTKHLRSNTGALLYSFFERDTFDINYSNGVFSGQIGSNIVYANIHEYGGFIKSKSKFSMFGGLMKKYKETGDEAYSIMALSALKHGGVNIPARPYFAPFVAEFNREGLPMWWNDVEKRLNEYINSVVFDV
jgi:phage gpG-like protein